MSLLSSSKERHTKTEDLTADEITDAPKIAGQNQQRYKSPAKDARRARRHKMRRPHSASTNRLRRSERLLITAEARPDPRDFRLRRDRVEKPCSEDGGKRLLPLAYDLRRLSNCVAGVKGRDERAGM